MNEEEKKLIEKFVEKCNKFDESVEIKGVSVGEEYRILGTVCKALDLVEKLQKEKEKKNTTENEYANTLLKSIDNIKDGLKYYIERCLELENKLKVYQEMYENRVNEYTKLLKEREN